MTDFDKHMILPYVQCGDFTLSTLSETCFHEPVFEINVKPYNTKNSQKNRQSHFTPKSKIVSHLDIIWYKLTHVNTC